MSLSQCCSCVSCGSSGVAGVLLPHLAGVVIGGAGVVAGRVVLAARPAAAEGTCPGCGVVSGRVHSRYSRRVRDMPSGGRDVVIRVEACRFFCLNPGCKKVTFAGQVTGVTSRFARRTPLLAGWLAAAGVALCGRAGARLAAGAGIAGAGRQAMIRLVMAAPVPELAAAPRVLGVDDFALRKGRVYGTVLIDVETGRVADLLPDREAASLKKWLQDHPGAEVICRDRAGAYAEGARQGAPGAIQVADRWHLWHNLCEKAYETAAAHRGSCLDGRDGHEHHEHEHEHEDGREDGHGQPAAPGLAERTRQRHAAVHRLLAAGHSKAGAARILGLSRPTIAKYAAAATPAQVTPAPPASALDPFKPYLTARWNQGARDARALHAEITARGYAGSDQPVRRYLAPCRTRPGPAPEPPPPVPSARDITTWLTTRPEDLTADDTAALAAVTAACPHLASLRDLTRRFAAMITDLTGTAALDTWLADADASELPALRTLANGIRKDRDAVLNGLSLPWSSGKVEGTVNKIKMLKRQTYGRAGFPLLRKRALLA